MSRIAFNLFLMTLCVVGLAFGCKHDGVARATKDRDSAGGSRALRRPASMPSTSQPTSRPAAASLAPPLETTWKSAPLPVQSEAVMIKEGPAPLVYMTESPGVFRVVDRTNNQTLADAFAARQTIIRVDDRNGVVFGVETIWPGPLAKGHKYAFYLQPDGENVARQAVVRPKR